MELLQLKYFKDAAELENFSKAAKKNMVPQPSISYAIKKLEDELGVLLFDRNGRKIFLNENGEYVYQKVSSILNTVENARHILPILMLKILSFIFRMVISLSHIYLLILCQPILMLILFMLL